MKTTLVILGAAVSTLSTVAQTLPFISTHPQSLVVAPGSNATFTVESTNATVYQWRFNGVDIAWGTASSLVITNAQTNNAGYYLVIAKNETGWTPSQLAYLSVVTPGQGGIVPFSNSGNSNSPARYHQVTSLYNRPITNGVATLYAGPQLDQMVLIGDIWCWPPPYGCYNPDSLSVNDGFFRSPGLRVPNVATGQLAWFRVDITYPLPSGGAFTQQSLINTQIAGAAFYLSTAPNSILFPNYWEWPEPQFVAGLCFPGEGYPLSTNQALAPGESPRIVQCPISSWDPSRVRVQWRKDGVPIPWGTNRILSITNFQSADVGVYDCQAFLSFFTGSFSGGAAQSRKYLLGIQTTNGGGLLRSPRLAGTGFVCDLEGITQRRYLVQHSTNLTVWTDLQTLTLTNGTGSFTNSVGDELQRYYRAVLLP